MGLTGAKASEGWGMGFFLVFFPEESPIISKKKTTLSSSSSSSSSSFKPSAAITTLFRNTNPSHLLTKAQSTISICALLFFVTLLIFTLSTLDPPTPYPPSRRHLSSHSLSLFKPTKPNPEIPSNSPALQGMGTLYRRGTTAMNDLIVCHILDSVTVQDFQLFLRVFFRSSLSSRSDLVFIFHNSTLISLDAVIHKETDSFLKLVRGDSVASFDVTQFVKSSKKEKERGEPIWGRRIRSNYSGEGESTELTRLSYGSVVSFQADELDPENSLSGFFDHVPMSLRRWACYPMLLGRVRRNFKHVMLVDVKDVLLFGDPLGRVRTRSPESVYLSALTQPSKHGKKNSDKTPSLHKLVNPAIIMGGGRGIRRLSDAMLTEIVRATTQPRKRKNSVTESGVLNQLTGNGFILKNINLVMATELIPDASSLNSASLFLSNYTVVRRGNSNIDINASIMRHLCSFPLDSSVYSDC